MGRLLIHHKTRMPTMASPSHARCVLQSYLSIPGGLSSILTLISLFSVLGCGNISGSIKSVAVSGSNVLDFKNTEIIAGDPVAADGVAEFAVIIHLKNSDNSSVSGYKPTYEISSGTGVFPRECTTSDSNGFSACVLKAIEPGIKRMRLTNALVGLEREVHFVKPDRDGKIIGLISGSRAKGETPNGMTIELAAGDAVKGIKRRTPNGLEIYFSVQGAQVSR